MGRCGWDFSVFVVAHLSSCGETLRAAAADLGVVVELLAVAVEYWADSSS